MRSSLNPPMKATIVITLLLLLTSCAMYTSMPVTDAVNSNKIRVGMSTIEVKRILGAADAVSKETTAGGSQEIWRYDEYNPTIRGCALTMISCSSACFVPVKPQPQYVIFENDKLIGWNSAKQLEETVPTDEDRLVK